MIAVILGGSRGVWDDLRAAMALIRDQSHLIVATNHAGTRYEGDLDAWVSLHPDFFASALPQRVAAGGNTPRMFAPEQHPDTTALKAVASRWNGSTSLYGAQIALKQMKATKVILCGAPLDADAGHIAVPGRWDYADRYRAGFTAALPDIKDKVRSMGGWSADLLGSPDADWLASRA